MGKLNDLWIKLGLKKGEFDRGMDDVKKKTKETESAFGKMKDKAVAVWAAIGAAVIKFGQELVSATNQTEDKWAMFTSKARAAWDAFVRGLVNNSSWSQFWADLKSSLAAAEQLTEALDADTEILNSIKIQKARMGNELEELNIAMRDQTKSYEERAAAAKRYMGLVDPIYAKEIERVNKLKDAQYEAFIAGSGWAQGAGYNQANQKVWEEMLVAYGDLTKIEALGGKTFAEALAATPDRYDREKESLDDFVTRFAQEKKALYDYAAQRFGLTQKQAAEWIAAFYSHYETHANGEQVDALVKTILQGYDADKARNAETRKVQSAYNSALAAMQKEAEAEQKIFDDALEYIEQSLQEGLDEIINEPVEIEVKPIEFDFSADEAEWDALVERHRARLQEIAELNQMLEDSIVQSLSGGLQAFTDLLAGLDNANASSVLSALLTPFADMAVKLGEMIVAEGLAVQAFKDSLSNPVGGGAAPIAAGLALIAIGSAVRSGMQAMARGGAGGAGASYGAESASSWANDINTEMTVYVKGRLDGGDLVLSGQQTINNWAR